MKVYNLKRLGLNLQKTWRLGSMQLYELLTFSQINPTLYHQKMMRLLPLGGKIYHQPLHFTHFAMHRWLNLFCLLTVENFSSGHLSTTKAWINFHRIILNYNYYLKKKLTTLVVWIRQSQLLLYGTNSFFPSHLNNFIPSNRLY